MTEPDHNELDLSQFQCLCCGTCCRWEGPVRVTDEELKQIAEYLGIPLQEFIDKHTVLTPDRRSLSLMEKEDGSCRYYDADTRYCQIQSVKPKQCRDFPFHWKFKGCEKLCAGGARLVELQKKKKNNNQKSEQEI